MQVPFDLPPFVVLRLHQAPAGGPQVLDRCPQFGGERGVAQDQARLRRQVHHELVFGAGQRFVLRLLQGQCAEQLAAVLDGYRAAYPLEGREAVGTADRDRRGRG